MGAVENRAYRDEGINDIEKKWWGRKNGGINDIAEKYFLFDNFNAFMINYQQSLVKIGSELGILRQN